MLESKIVKFLVPVFNPVDSFLNFVSFFIVMTHNSPDNFKLIILPQIKAPNKSYNS